MSSRGDLRFFWIAFEIILFSIIRNLNFVRNRCYSYAQLDGFSGFLQFALLFLDFWKFKLGFFWVCKRSLNLSLHPQKFVLFCHLFYVIFLSDMVSWGQNLIFDALNFNV